MTISGIMPLRNAVKLGYPFELALRSLQRFCDEVVVAVDPTSEDETLTRVRALGVRVVESVWDLDNHGGHEGKSEIAQQTQVALDAATGDWILSLQADEVLHEEAVAFVRNTVAQKSPYVGYELPRLYFYGGLDWIRKDWTMPLVRLFRRGFLFPDPFCGAMNFVPPPMTAVEIGVLGQVLPASRSPGAVFLTGTAIYHYSRVGDPQAVALRVRNLDTFYHEPGELLTEPEVPKYDFSELRQLDTYVREHEKELAATELLQFFGTHPAGVKEYYRCGSSR